MNNLSPFYETFYWAINNTWPMLTLFTIIMLVLKITKVIINKDHFTFYKEFYNLLFIIYILLLYYLLLSTEKAASGINIIPFKEMTRYSIGSKLFFYNAYIMFQCSLFSFFHQQPEGGTVLIHVRGFQRPIVGQFAFRIAFQQHHHVAMPQ